MRWGAGADPVWQKQRSFIANVPINVLIFHAGRLKPFTCVTDGRPVQKSDRKYEQGTADLRIGIQLFRFQTRQTGLVCNTGEPKKGTAVCCVSRGGGLSATDNPSGSFPAGDQGGFSCSRFQFKRSQIIPKKGDPCLQIALQTGILDQSIV